MNSDKFHENVLRFFRLRSGPENESVSFNERRISCQTRERHRQRKDFLVMN